MAEEAHERIQVTAPPDVCFGIATDFERYPEWANNVRQVKVLTRDEQGRGSTVEFRVAGLGRSVRQVFAYDYANAFDFGAQPTSARVQLRQYAIPAASRQYLAAHPVSEHDEDDPT